MEAAFQVGKQNRHRLDALFIPQIFEAFFADFVDGNTVDTFSLGLQIEFFEFLIREGKEITVFGRHGSPFGDKGYSSGEPG